MDGIRECIGGPGLAGVIVFSDVSHGTGKTVGISYRITGIVQPPLGG